jgi:hypothetical protein
MDKLGVPAAGFSTMEVVVVLGLLESYLESFGSVTERERPETYEAMQRVKVKLRRLLDANRARRMSA